MPYIIVGIAINSIFSFFAFIVLAFFTAMLANIAFFIELAFIDFVAAAFFITLAFVAAGFFIALTSFMAFMAILVEPSRRQAPRMRRHF